MLFENDHNNKKKWFFVVALLVGMCGGMQAAHKGVSVVIKNTRKKPITVKYIPAPMLTDQFFNEFPKPDEVLLRENVKPTEFTIKPEGKVTITRNADTWDVITITDASSYEHAVIDPVTKAIIKSYAWHIEPKLPMRNLVKERGKLRFIAGEKEPVAVEGTIPIVFNPITITVEKNGALSVTSLNNLVKLVPVTMRSLSEQENTRYIREKEKKQYAAAQEEKKRQQQIEAEAYEYPAPTPTPPSSDGDGSDESNE